MFPITLNEKNLMQLALDEANSAFDAGEIPIGAIVIDENSQLIAKAHNEQIKQNNTIAHAELLVINDALRKRKSKYLNHCTLIVTLEPCIMCAGAIAHARFKKVIFGAWDEKTGACGSVYDVLRDSRLPHPKPEVVGGVFEAEAARLMQEFFNPKRN